MCTPTDFEVSDSKSQLARGSPKASMSAEISGASIAFLGHPWSDELHRAASAHRSAVISTIVLSALRAAATNARRVYVRHVQRERARAANAALRTLDDRTLHDLGIHRSELNSVEWAEEMKEGVDASLGTSRSPTVVNVDARSPGATAKRSPSPGIATRQQNEERLMPSYKPSTPRFAFGLVAAAMMAITMGVMVVAPAAIEAGHHEATTLAASEIAPAVLRGASASSPIVVAALHNPWLALAEASHVKRIASLKSK